jgi:hypothetical protein
MKSRKTTWANAYKINLELEIIHKDANVAKKGVTVAAIETTKKVTTEADLTNEDLEAINTVWAQKG